MNDILSPRLRGQLRHMLTAFGPVLAMHSQTSDAEWQLYVGLAMAVLGFVDSWRAPEKSNVDT